MERTDLALDARLRGEFAQALLYFREAYDLESKAATILANDLEGEPTRSVLLRSAASLALDCGLIPDAEKLICTALIGHPPEEIAEELRDLLEQVHFQRHLELRGVALHETEVQMSISGKSVGFGIAPIDAFLNRVQDSEKLLYRTAERLRKFPFRVAGRISSAILDSVELYATVPRASSFAVSFRVGRSTQITMPGIASSLGEETIDDMLECLELFNSGEQDKLKVKIPQEDYYNNFVGLARNIAPDGREVNLVGFTTVRHGSLKKVSLTAKSDILPTTTFVRPAVTTQGAPEDGGVKTVQGILKEADSRNKERGKIHIVDSEGTSHTIIVPPGMMTDIVRPLWESEVLIVGTQKRKVIHLIEIRPVKGR
jgi:hypothetical protein